MEYLPSGPGPVLGARDNRYMRHCSCLWGTSRLVVENRCVNVSVQKSVKSTDTKETQRPIWRRRGKKFFGGWWLYV